MTVLRAAGIRLAYDGHTVLDGVDLTIRRGETVGLSGPSGSGKSSLVQVLAMLTAPDAGLLSVDDSAVTGTRYRVPAAVRRHVAVLFQSPRAACDPRLTLLDLVAEPLRGRQQRSATTSEARRLADTVGLTDELLGRRPHAVSDGQLQRACLARALAQRPRYLLCDEATAMLDASTQALVAALIRDYQSRTGAGVLVVSHDPALLTRWADRTERL